MKKWEKGIYVFCGTLFFMICIVLAVIHMYGNKMDNKDLESIHTVILLGCLVVMIGIIIPYFVKAVLIIKNGMHNIKKCDDLLFENIDKFKHCWGESNENYIRLIQIVNLYYVHDGRVDELIKNNEIERLLKRKDYLLKQRYLFDDLSSYFCSLVISVIASFILQMVSLSNPVYMMVWMLLILGSFFTISLFRYSERGNAGSYKYLVEEYELACLNRKIDKLNLELVITDEDEKVLIMQQRAIDMLIDKRTKAKKKKDKKKIEKDIKTVEKLHLCLNDYSCVFLRMIHIEEQKLYLAYDVSKGKENNYIGNLNLKTRDYSIFYDVLVKYDEIIYIQ